MNFVTNHIIRISFPLIILLFQFTSTYSKPYKGGELRTFATYTYGRFEVRMKSAAGSGVVSSFFTYHDVYPHPPEVSNEIDIEILGRYQNQVQFNTITPGDIHHVFTKIVSFNPHEDFHNYAIEWTPNYVAWFIDGEQVHMQYGTHIGELNRSQKIMMNLWPPTYVEWAGEWDENILPVYAYYDWVKFYSYDPDSGNYGTGNLFRLSWEDYFNTWDTSRWQKATHTFDGNNCDFTPENVVFYQGYMILCLTTPENTGYHGGPVSIWGKMEIPVDHLLLDAYPNPFNSELKIKLMHTGRITSVEIMDINGKMIKQFNNLQIGKNEVIWDGRDESGKDVSSGIYLIVVKSSDVTKFRKVVFLK